MYKIQKTVATTAIAIMLFGSSFAPVAADTDRGPLYGPNTDFVSCATGGTPTAKKFGFARITTSANQVLAKVVVRKGIPNTTYDIYVNQDPGDCPTTPTGTVTTNSKGDGWAWVLENKIPGATHFWVSAVGGGQVLRSPVESSPEPDEF